MYKMYLGFLLALFVVFLGAFSAVDIQPIRVTYPTTKAAGANPHGLCNSASNSRIHCVSVR